jgi:hypothetical protein
MSDVRWVTIRDAVKLTDLPPTTLRRRVEQGTFELDKSSRPHLYGIPESYVIELDGLRMESADTTVGAAMESGGVRGEPGGVRSEFGGARSEPRGVRSESVADMTDSDGHRIARLEEDKVRLDEDKAHLREELRASREHFEREALDACTKYEARVGALEETLVVREVRITEMTEQVSVLEAKVREILEKGQDEAMGLANRIADLVERQQAAESRIYELQPVAERVPMLEAAVDETKTRLHETEGDLVERDKKLFDRERQLADISEDIETIASRPVAGPVFRLLTKGKLRI